MWVALIASVVGPTVLELVRFWLGRADRLLANKVIASKDRQIAVLAGLLREHGIELPSEFWADSGSG